MSKFSQRLLALFVGATITLSPLTTLTTPTMLVIAQGSSGSNNDGSCSSDDCTDFKSFQALVEHVHRIQEMDNNDGGSGDDLVTVCLCGRRYQDDACRSNSTAAATFRSNDDNDDNDALVMYINQTNVVVSIGCVGFSSNAGEPCLWNCPHSAAVVRPGASLQLIGSQGNFVWAGNRTMDNDSMSKVTVETGGSLLVSGMQFANIATPSLSGGAIDIAGGEAQILDSVFSNCSAHLYGGAIHVESTTGSSSSSLDVRRCLFADNTAPLGGAVYVGSNVSKASILDCSFTKNMIIFDDDDDKLISASLEYNLTRDSNNTDSVYVAPETTSRDIEFCSNAGLEDLGCSSSGSLSLETTFFLRLWLLLSSFLVGCSAVALMM